MLLDMAQLVQKWSDARRAAGLSRPRAMNCFDGLTILLGHRSRPGNPKAHEPAMTKEAPRWLKPTVDYLPLAAFLAVYLGFGLMAATAALMTATAAGVVLSLAIARRVPVMPLVTALIVGIFGGLTLWLNDERFVKMKPTIVQGLFSLVLFGGLAFGRPLLGVVLGHAWQMDDKGWRLLTLRFAFFFAMMAALNELVWRTQSTDFWVTYKVFGILGLTMVFAMSQAPLMQRHHLPPDPAAERPSENGRPETRDH